ncbi:MAG: hypothetical protein JW841_03825 [Deltaproteobacteria bacterium]|nr:hypothetical protein [Deltaproteobacteria bacterium]
MAQGYRIEQYEQYQKVLEQYQRTNEQAETQNEVRQSSKQAARVSEDGVELRSQRQGAQAVTDSHREVDLEGQRTRNLQQGRITPESFGQNQNGKHQVVVKTEPRSMHYDGQQPKLEPRERRYGLQGWAKKLGKKGRRQRRGFTDYYDDLPEWYRTTEAYEEAIDINEDFYEASQNPTTTGVVASVQGEQAEVQEEIVDATHAQQEVLTSSQISTTNTKATIPASQLQKSSSAKQATNLSNSEETVVAQVPKPKEKPSTPRPVSRIVSTEATSVNFSYPKGGAFISELANGVTVESGKGKTYVGPEPTLTNIKRIKA